MLVARVLTVNPTGNRARRLGMQWHRESARGALSRHAHRQGWAQATSHVRRRSDPTSSMWSTEPPRCPHSSFVFAATPRLAELEGWHSSLQTGSKLDMWKLLRRL